MKNLKRVMAFIISAALSAGTVMNHPYNIRKASARTIDEIQQEREANSRKIADLEQQMNILDQNKAEEQKYQDMLTEQLNVIADNINLLNAEIEQLSQNIISSQETIVQLDAAIEDQENAIDEKVETFKKRLCEMYVSSNDNFASILVGTSSFYDIISRVEMLNRIADYDQNLIDDILSEISSMEDMKSALDAQKAELEESISRQEASVAEKNAEVQMLNEKIASSQQTMAALTHEQLLVSGNREQLAEENAKLEKEAQEAHDKYAQEAQRLYEEEMRRKGKQVTSIVTHPTTQMPVIAETTVSYETSKPVTTRKTTVTERKTAATTYATAEITQHSETLPPVTKPPVTLPPETTPVPTTTPEPVITTVPTTAAPVETAALVDDTSEWTWPVPGHYNITSYFGYRAEFDEFHKGIDISDMSIDGQPVVAARSGIVAIALDGCTHDYPKINGVATCSCNGFFGNYVQISHDSSTYSRYGHMKGIAVKQGQYVQKGDIIGYVGCTGWSTGSHLHFDVNVNGSFVDPQQFVSN